MINNKNNIIKDITEWAQERRIDKISPTAIDYITNVVEELLELSGYTNSHRGLLKEQMESVIESLGSDTFADYQKPMEDDVVDSIADILVFSLTELLKYGYDPECVLKQVYRHIDSRRGEIEDGKFIKFTDDFHKSLWVEPNYKECKNG